MSIIGKPQCTPEFDATHQALLDARNVFARNVAANDGGFELNARTGFQRLERNLDTRELTGTTRLLLMRVIDIDCLRDRLAIRNLRRTDISLDLEFDASCDRR